MSGGRWCYNQSNLGYEMFPGCDVDYGLGVDTEYRHYSADVKRARKLNPMEDKQLSELVFDVLCLIYSVDWYQSGDTGEEQYLADVAYFKQKWLKVKPEKAIKAEIDKNIAEAKEDLYKAFGIANVHESEKDACEINRLREENKRLRNHNDLLMGHDPMEVISDGKQMENR